MELERGPPKDAVFSNKNTTRKPEKNISSPHLNEPKSEQEQTIAGIFKTTLLASLSETSANGLSNIVKNRNWIVKIFWSVLFLGGLGASAYCNLFFNCKHAFTLKIF